jgi:hypothetical protein
MLDGVAAVAVDDVMGADHGVQNEAAVSREKLGSRDKTAQQITNGMITCHPKTPH